MERRDFIKAVGAATGALAGAAIAPAPARAQDDLSVEPRGTKPNILFILVDELRFPTVFPTGVNSVDGFLARFMPNLHSLWQRGVKFGHHYTAASACTPSRGVIITGLYSQQSWLCATLTNQPGQRSVTPILNPAFPTYGKLLRRSGYQTPYVGKWHVSFDTRQLEPYGFEGLIYPDPTGYNLQGTVGQEPDFPNDQDISNRAVQWLNSSRPGKQPWCLTVSFVNPHDQQFFWGGTEFQTYNNLFGSGSLQPILEYSTADNPPTVAWDNDPLKSPPSFGYPGLPPNWESAATLAAKKPSTQVFGREVQAAIWGDVAQDSGQSSFAVRRYPVRTEEIGMGVSPFAYWQRALDSYTNVMTIVVQRIGEVLRALPADVAENTVILFASDHGEYAGAHGYVAGKILSCYEEAYHVPLIVVDPSGRLTGDIQTVRTGLTSSVDFLPLIVSLGHDGSRDWIRGRLASIYGGRHDMLPMLRSASAPGRPYVLLATDELIPGELNFNNAPIHIVGLRTDNTKLGTYANWISRTAQIETDTLETEFYDYATPEGAAELASTPGDPRAKAMLQQLLGSLIPEELQAPLPEFLRLAQAVSREAYLLLAQQVLQPDQSGSARQRLHALGYGREF